MVYCTDNMCLQPIHETIRGSQNDVIDCRDLKSPIGAQYTAWVIHGRECTKKLLHIFEHYPRELLEGESPFLKQFIDGEEILFLFDYRPSRELRRFAFGQMPNVQAREKVSIDLVMACIASPMPFPILCQMLEQGCVNITGDGSVYFTYDIDLSEVKEEDGEALCADLCVNLVLELLDRNEKLKSMRLLHKKLEKSAYQSLTELYRDIRLTLTPEKKPSIMKRIKGVWYRNKDRWFRWLLVFSVFVVLFTLLILLSQLIFGDVPLFRLFGHTMDVVGRETLAGGR